MVHYRGVWNDWETYLLVRMIYKSTFSRYLDTHHLHPLSPPISYLDHISISQWVNHWHSTVRSSLLLMPSHIVLYSFYVVFSYWSGYNKTMYVIADNGDISPGFCGDSEHETPNGDCLLHLLPDQGRLRSGSASGRESKLTIANSRSYAESRPP